MSERDFVTALSRGLAVIRAFNRNRPEMTLTEVAARTSLSPATARRSLYTLQQLGYISSHGRRFMLRSKVLDLGSAFWSSMKIEEVAQAHLREVVDAVGDSCSLAVLEGKDVLYLGHAASRRTVRMPAGIGARFPAYATSIGRAMLAYLDPGMLERYLDTVEMKALTDRTVTDATRLKQILAEVRKNGYACTQDELDYGLSSVAVPVMIGERAVAAINTSSNSARMTKDELAKARVGILQRTALAIAQALEQSPALLHSLNSNQTEPYLSPPPPPRLTEGRAAR
ncbi:MAG TPA: IclR family transcriptional regulator C-terminal domain-containing protein [Stellaceae bacterium]|jgi:IclR family pca regulon transcriptional regulator